MRGRAFNAVLVRQSNRAVADDGDPVAVQVYVKRPGVVETRWRWQDSQGAPSLDQSFWLQLPKFMRAASVSGLEWIAWIAGAFSGRGLGELVSELWSGGDEYYVPAIDESEASSRASERPWVAFRLNAAALEVIGGTIAADRVDTEHEIDALCLIGVPKQHYQGKLLRLGLSGLLDRGDKYDSVVIMVDRYGADVRVFGSKATCELVSTAFCGHQEVERAQE